MSKKDKKVKEKNDDFLAKEAKEREAQAEEYTIDIPEDEIWTYQIEGLQKPHINKPYENAGIKKVVIVVSLLIAIGIAIFLSFRVVHNDTYSYNDLGDGTYELVKFTNPGSVKKIKIDYVVDNETGKKDLTKPISKISAYAFNCDEVLNEISFGKDVKSIDGKSIYSCWWVQNVWIDDANEAYCDIDGVIYNKDLTEVVFYPNDHDKYLREKTGYNNLVDDDGNPMEELFDVTKKYDQKFLDEYNKAVRTYVIPSTVTKIGQLAFAYSNITDLYIPEGVKRMESMAVFKNTSLLNVYSYKTDKPITDVTYKAIDSMSQVYNSLPEGLEYIGSDCFYYCRGLKYMYLPSSIKEIGHHAFWDACYKEGDDLIGITAIDTALSETDFEGVKTGPDWLPRYNYMLFTKAVDVNYGAQRK